MLEYEWGNPSTIMLTGDEHTQDSDQTRQIFDDYHRSLSDNHHQHQQFLSHSTTNNPFSHQNFQQQQQQQDHHSDIQSLYNDPRSHYSTQSYQPPPQTSMLNLDTMSLPTGVGAAGGGNGGGGGGGGGGGFLVMPKSEEISHRQGDFTARIGLNLGHRTYFSTDDDFVNRLYRRSRPGTLDPGSVNSPRCQAEGCSTDLTHAKHYHRRHKVCEFHSKASTVIANGLTQRFCQQCSRFHLLSEFDNGKRSCRKRLADHNRRRRKSQQQPNHDQQKPPPLLENSLKPSSEILARSPPDSGAHSSSSVTVAVSPPRMSLDCFRQRSYQTTASSAPSSSPFLFE